MGPVRAIAAMLLAITLVLISSTGEARDRRETCDSYERATGTVVTDCRRPGEKPRTCETVEHITGTTTTTCR